MKLVRRIIASVIVSAVVGACAPNPTGNTTTAASPSPSPSASPSASATASPATTTTTTVVSSDLGIPNQEAVKVLADRMVEAYKVDKSTNVYLFEQKDNVLEFRGTTSDGKAFSELITLKSVAKNTDFKLVDLANVFVYGTKKFIDLKAGDIIAKVDVIPGNNTWSLGNATKSVFVLKDSYKVTGPKSFVYTVDFSKKMKYSYKVERLNMTTITADAEDAQLVVDVGADAPGSGAFTITATAK